jgi:competence protein ComEC
MKSRIALGVALLFASLALACQQQEAPPPKKAPEKSRYFGGTADGSLHVYFFDVGAGDAALIVTPKGNTVLVDSGPASAESHLVNRLPELLRKELDLVVLTQPDPKHYGSLDAVLKRVGAKRLLEPRLPDTSKDYDALLNGVGARGVGIITPALSTSTPGQRLQLTLEPGVTLTVLWPRAPLEPLLGGIPDAAGRNAANGIVLRLAYGDTSVLFAGAARGATEARLLERGLLEHATLLKAGSPGVDGANSQAWLETVRPQATVLSGDEGLARSAKVKELLTRLKGVGAQAFRTDVNGEVHAVSDGTRFELKLQRPSQGEPSSKRHVFPGVDPRPPLPRTEAKPPVAEAKPPVTEVKPTSEPTRVSETPRVPPSRGGDVLDVDDLPAATRKGKRGGDSSRALSQDPGPAMGGGYMASRKKNIFHKPTCRSVRLINPENLLTFKTRAEAERSGRAPAGDCRP